MTLNDAQVRKGQAFGDAHLADGIFIMPNAWNARSAYLIGGGRVLHRDNQRLPTVWHCRTARVVWRGMPRLFVR